jgi:hypothetical protein
MAGNATYVGGRNPSFANPSGKNPLATTPSQPNNWLGGGGGSITSDLPPYLYANPLPQPGPTQQPAAAKPDGPSFLDLLMQSVLNPGKSGTVKSSYDIKGALKDIGGVYAPELSALDKLVAQKKGMSNDNAGKLKTLYASLVADTHAQGAQGDKNYTDLMGKQTASTQAERDAITQRYAQQLADMQKQMTDSGFANLIPVRTQKLQDQMNHELANINTQGDIGQNQSRGLQGSQHNWFNESANVNQGQGVNAQAANMRQLQDALSQIDQQRAGVLSNKAQAQASANAQNRASISAARSASNKASAPNYALALQIYKLQQDAKAATTKASADATQQKIDNLIKIAGLGKGVVNGTTGQSTYDPSIADTLQKQIAALG